MSKAKRACVLDLETLSLSENATILSIGAAVILDVEKRLFETTQINLTTEERAALHKSAAAVQELVDILKL